MSQINANNSLSGNEMTPAPSAGRDDSMTDPQLACASDGLAPGGAAVLQPEPPAPPAEADPSPRPGQPPTVDPQGLLSTLTRQGEMLDAVAGVVADTRERIASLESSQAQAVQWVAEVRQQVHRLTSEGPLQSPRSLLNDLFRLYDAAIALGDSPDDRELISVAEFRQRISLMGIQISQVLQLHGLSLIEPQVGDPFNARLHNARQGVPCDDPALHRTIRAVHHPGFHNESFVFRPAVVDVWVCRDSKNGPPPTASAPLPAPAAAAAAEFSASAGGEPAVPTVEVIEPEG